MQLVNIIMQYDVNYESVYVKDILRIYLSCRLQVLHTIVTMIESARFQVTVIGSSLTVTNRTDISIGFKGAPLYDRLILLR